MARQVIYDYGDSASTIDGILKEDYVIQKITNTVNMATYFLSQLRSEKTTAGRRFVFPVQFGVGEGQGNAAENENLPQEGFGEHEQALGNVVYQYGALYITGQSIAATRTMRAAFVSALKEALKNCRDGFKLNTQRQVWGDGTGAIAKVASGSSGTTVSVTDPYGYSYVASDLDANQKVRLFRRNMRVWFSDADEHRIVTGINIAAGTITVDSAVTVTTSDVIYRSNTASTTSQNKELLGVGKVVATTGSYLNIARSGTPEWQGQVVQLGSGSGGDLDEQSMQSVVDQVEIYGSGDVEPDLLVTDHKTRRRYLELLVSQKRFVNTLELQGGFKALEFNGKPLMVDKDAPPQRIWFFHMSDWMWMTMQPQSWIQRDGTILKWVDGKDAFRAYWHAYRNLVCKRPANQAVLYDITGAATSES